MEKLDLKDKKIILELFSNGRASNSQIARNVGLSKEVVIYRINNLYKKGVIKRIIPVINYNALGLTPYKFLIRLEAKDDKKEKEIFEDLKKSEHVSSVIDTDGEWDYIINFLVEDKDEFSKFVDSFLKKHGHIIDEKVILLESFRNYFSPSFLFKKKEIKYQFTKSKKTIDLIDMQKNILKVLYDDARTSLVQISKEVNSSITTVKYHLKKLKDQNVILGYRLILDERKIGYDKFRVLLELRNHNEKEKLKQILVLNKNVTALVEMVGTYDVEFEAEFRNANLLMDFVNELKEQIIVTNFHILFKNEEIIVNGFLM